MLREYIKMIERKLREFKMIERNKCHALSVRNWRLVVVC